MVMLGVLVTARTREFWMNCRPFSYKLSMIYTLAMWSLATFCYVFFFWPGLSPAGEGSSTRILLFHVFLSWDLPMEMTLSGPVCNMFNRLYFTARERDGP